MIKQRMVRVLVRSIVLGVDPAPGEVRPTGPLVRRPAPRVRGRQRACREHSKRRSDDAPDDPATAAGRKVGQFFGAEEHAENALQVMSGAVAAGLRGLNQQRYLHELIRGAPHWPQERYLESFLAEQSATRRARLAPAELAV